MNIEETKKSIIQAGHKAVEELIKIAKEAIVEFEILNRIQEEERVLTEIEESKLASDKPKFKGFAEGRSK